MKILIAPNAFKGSLTAPEAAQAIAAGVRRVLPHADLVQIPIADGGDGTLDTIMSTAEGRYIEADVLNPLAEMTRARFGLLHDGTAIIEMAEASGLRLIGRDRLNPMRTTTYGTGQLIAAALDHGAKRIIVGVGGSATVDGGLGMAQALGVELLAADGSPVPYGGEGLRALNRVSLARRDARLGPVEVIVACDVTNPLCGPEGAACVFGPQKGATPDQVQILDAALRNMAEICRRDLDKQIANLPGSGAAGGLAAGLVAFLDARIESGAGTLLKLLDVDKQLENVDLVITGEGAIDSQTIYGKAPIGIALLARAKKLPVIAIAGMLAEDADVVYEHGISALMATEDRPMSLDEALKDAPRLIEGAAERALRLFMSGYHTASMTQPGT